MTYNARSQPAEDFWLCGIQRKEKIDTPSCEEIMINELTGTRLVNWSFSLG